MQTRTKTVTIDRSKLLRDDPGTGHNRWHPDIEPIVEIKEGEELALETRDAIDGQMTKASIPADLPSWGHVSHPLTGPVYVAGAEPGDLLEVEFVEIVPEPYGWTAAGPQAGFLPDLLSDWFFAHWDIADGWATSQQLPGVAIPGAPFMGCVGVAPSRELLQEWWRREDPLEGTSGAPYPRTAADAVPATEKIAAEAARTIPPRENFGNVDAKQLTQGSKLFVPVFVDGALYSAGDAHFAQGDNECCMTAIEMGATHVVRFRLHKGEAERRGIRWPRFAHEGYFAPPEWAVPRNFTATIGLPVTSDGANEAENVTLAARNALRNMVELLEERGWSREQAYVICSVAVDLRVSNVVDLPNVTVSAFLPENIFRDGQ